MTTPDSTTKKVHHGRNIKRFRELFDIKQEALAHELGEDWTQTKVSRLEEKETIDEQVLKQVATILKVPVDAIKKFDEEKAVQIISNTFNDSSILNGINYNPTFNAVEKWMEVLEENKKLYERLLAAEREKVALMEKLFDKK